MEHTKTPVKVLDKGFVTLMDHMGSDLSVVNAARVSFSKESNWERQHFDPVTREEDVELRVLHENDEKLIAYLGKHNHWTPFGHCQVTLHFKMPIFVARQFMRSNVGIVYNEISRRYVDNPPEFYMPDKWRGRPPKSMKQGSSDEEVTELSHPEGVDDLWGGHDNAWHPTLHVGYGFQMQYEMYMNLIKSGVAPEQARIVLPLSTYTEFWATMSLAAAARVVGLRADPHAQWEIQEYARAIDHLIKPLFPVSWAALTRLGEVGPC